MGFDVHFNVNCCKVTTVNHTFTTDTPWKEIKELQEQGYEIVRSSTTDAILQKVESIEAPSILYIGGFDFFEQAQQLFQKQQFHFKEWCKWECSRSNSLTSIRDIKTTIGVWDDLWEDILKKITNPKDFFPYTDFLNMIYTQMKLILQYAIDHENIHIFTKYELV
jgi:hypothetical protein